MGAPPVNHAQDARTTNDRRQRAQDLIMALKNKTQDIEKASIRQRTPPQHQPAVKDHQRPMDPVTALKLATSAHPSALRPADILSLQRTIGNHAVQRMLSSHPHSRSHSSATPANAIQRQTEGEELLQAKFAPVQRNAPAAPAPAVSPAPEIDQGNADLWRQRVDAAVRAQFGLSGAALTTGRAHFVNQGQFAAQIDAADMPEHLLMLFLDPPPGSGIHDILRRHHQSFSGIAELRTFIADRIAVNSFEMSVVDPVTRATDVQTITPRELLAANIGGLAATRGPRAGRSVLIQIPAHIETLVHEAVHFYVHTRFRDWANQHPDDLVFGFRRKTLLMEGFAEYFARQVMETNSSVFGPLVTRAYQPLVERVWRVVITQTEQLARDAYFKGDTAALSRLQQAIQINEQTHPDLL